MLHQLLARPLVALGLVQVLEQEHVHSLACCCLQHSASGSS